ncbi:hypothetical protein [Billgrantia endophytica]|uniref:Uncharacterized protein n=1 Tax=Billgrantia endophytica TaxID=2033802 RepID=A0A2N7TUC6_9GAMM|nr:hypothetical protein [Halomonas endophytica]PMR71790.1 hypothetical protein C1H69_22925 [Halomonas endophytica]
MELSNESIEQLKSVDFNKVVGVLQHSIMDTLAGYCIEEMYLPDDFDTEEVREWIEENLIDGAVEKLIKEADALGVLGNS